MASTSATNELLIEKSSKMWDALRKAQRAVYLIGQDVKKIQSKVAELNRPVALEQAQEECYTFRLQLTDQTYHKAVTSIKKVMQSGGTCVVSRTGENSSLHIHSSFPIDVLLQKLKLSKGDVKVEQQAAFFFNVLGLTGEGEQAIEEALNCNALGGFVNAAAVSGAMLVLFTKPSIIRSPDVLPELFTVALSFDRHHCPLSRVLPLSKPYKLGVYGMWCSTQTLFTIKAALEEKLGDMGLISVMTNPHGRTISVYVQGLENAIKGRSKLVSIVKGLGYRCAPKNNRVLLFDTFGPHVANLHKEVKVDAARSNAAQYQEALDPQIATPDPDQSLLRTSVLNTLRNLGYAASVTGCAEIVFNLHGVKCVNCAGKIRQAIQQGPQKHLSGYLNLFRNQLTVKTSDDAVEDSIAQIVKALRAIKVHAEPLRVAHDVSDEPDPATEEEYSILRRLTGKVLLRKDIGEGDLEAFSDDSDALRSMNSPITTAAFHVTGLTCQSCALLLRGTLKTVLQGITSCAIDFASRTLYVSYGSEAISPDEIREKLASLGHSAALLQEGEDLKLKLTDTLWANENAAVPTEDEKTQAMLDSQLLLYELQPQPIASQPLLELKHYASLEETGVEVQGAVSGSSVPTYHHVTTLPIKLLQDPKDPKNLPVYISVFSQAAGDRDALDDDDDAKAKGILDTSNEAFFLVVQSPSLFSKDAQNLSPRAPGLDYLEPPTLHFAHQWTFWFDVTVDTKEKNAEDSLRELGTFSTIQEFWRYWNNMCVSHLTDGCNLRLFRHDIQPTWEHPKNRNGGRWSARSLGKGRRFKLWTEVVLSLLGEQLQDNSEHQVCGICLSSKPGGDRIEVWVDGGHETPDSGDNKAGDTMDELLRKMLFPDEDKKYFFYQSHLDYIEQRKTQRGGRRAKARKQNQGDGGFDQDRAEEPRPRYYQDYDYTPPGVAQGYLGTSSAAYRPGYGGADMRSSGVLSGVAGPRPAHHMPPRPYGPPQAHPAAAYYGGKGHSAYPKPQYPAYQSYMGGYGAHLGHGGKGGHSPFMHMQQQQPQRPPYMSGPPTMTPGEADNILAMHSMSGSGLSAPEPPPWSVDISKNVAPPSSEGDKGEEEEDFDPTAVGMEVGRAQSLDIEIQYREVENCYATLRQYQVPVPIEEAQLAAGLRHYWAQLLDQAKKRDESLTAVKDKFRKVTQEQVKEFLKALGQAKHDFQLNGPGKAGMDLDRGLDLVNDWKVDLKEKQKKRDILIKAEKLFGLPITSFQVLSEVEHDLQELSFVYDVYSDWKETLGGYSNMQWVDVQPDSMVRGTEAFIQRLKKMDGKYKELEPFNPINETVRNFFDSLPLLKDLKHEALRDRHWKMLMDATGRTFDFGNFTLQNLVDMRLYEYREEILNIVAGAARELSIEKSLTSIKETWRGEVLGVKKYERAGMDRGCILMDTTEISEKIDDNIMNLQSISNVKWVKPFLQEVHMWEKKLALMGEVLMVWMQVQMKWMYLESIFVGSEDIANQLPKEAKKFEDIDKKWLKIMAETEKNPNVDQACHMDGRLSDFNYLADKLDECQKGLSDYLETKRMAFPRFYFISDDELLSILGSSDPRSVQEHMLKMFDNCALLLFKGDTAIIEGVQSAEGERLMFVATVNTEGHQVEKWLTLVLKEKKRTLTAVLKEGTFYYPKMIRVEWINKYHGQIAMTGSKIWWTYQVEDGFKKVKAGKKTAIKELATKLTRQLNDLVAEMDKNLEKKYRKKCNTMIIVDVHARDIVDRFVRDSIMDPREFDWESQLRMYWEKSVDNCIIRQCTGEFDYGHEYMGLNGRLVITPLTDRCFMTLTQALTFKLGGAPAGPAGTGKTESTKDLAKALGIFCVVFNCGEGLDYKAMASIFSGLAQCGAWGCFDEFNRIELPVLSVVAEQLRSIQHALKLNLKRFLFSGEKDMALDSKVGVFITMNPGYAGRVELPDNLKALFRPCVMVLPDLAIICEIMLFSEGFKSARVLAQKMVSLYSLARGQLSKQFHYDWGLRALKSVLVMAGALKRGDPDKPEDVVLMRALRDMNAPKFVFEDVPLFLGLIDDLFPGLVVERVTQEALAKAVQNDLKSKGYQYLPTQADKVVQLYETMLTRHTTMVVGPTQGGKTVIITTLQNAQTDLKLPTKIFVVNAKAQHISELYGVLDPVTRTWTDGLFSNIFRTINKVSDKEGADRERKYVLFDGDVDALWVENMNSVMDDNKLLTLPNGERIRVHPTCALLFEVGDLQYASPATVSRAGMVYVDPKNLGWLPYVWKWMNTRNKEEAETMRELFVKYVKPCVDFVLDGVELDGSVTKPPRMALPLVDMNMVIQLCTLLQTILTEKRGITEPKALETIVLFCLVWSIGGCVIEDDRRRFDTFLKGLCGWPMQDNGEKLERSVGAGSLPERLTLYEYYVDEVEARWKPWKALVQPFTPPADGKFSSILVPTVDTARTAWFLERIVSNKSPVLLIGGSGTAKTVTIQNFLRDLKVRSQTPEEDAEEVQLEALLLELNFSSRTTSTDVQRSLEDNVEKRTNTVLGPAAGKRLVVFIDDVNMPKVDTYGTMQPIAFLKLLIDKGAWYDRKDLQWKQVKDLQYIAAMAPPGGGRNALDPRFISLFCCANVAFPSTDSLETIYNQILAAHLENFPSELQELPDRITKMTLELYRTIVDKLPATPTKFHYIFNLRDLSRIYESLCRATPEKFPHPCSMARLWRNECMRVFYDRLIDDKDRELVQEKMTSLLEGAFANDMPVIMAEPLLYGDFLDFFREGERSRLYEDMGDYTKVRPVVEGILDEYNDPVPRMNLVMFDMALDHTVRVTRIITVDRGNALLVGVGGSGKQSLTRLSTFTAGYKLFEITLCRGYGEELFREDLKKLYNIAGVQNEPVVFLFTDAQVAQEGFLELINNMLASGMVPALFADDEKESLMNTVVDEVLNLGMSPTKDNKWSYFVNRCRNNLHIVLCMSPSGETLRTRCRNFPGLVNNTVIDWFPKWPQQALAAVSRRFLEKETLPDEVREAITEVMVKAHTVASQQSVLYAQQLRRFNYVTPKNYLDYIENYKKLLLKNRTNINEVVNRLGTGLERLAKAAVEVAEMSKSLAEQEVFLAQKSKENEELITEISSKKQVAEEKHKSAVEKEEALVIQKQEIIENKEDAEQALAEAMPIVEEAEAALQKITKDAINEIRTFAKPSERVVAVGEMVCVLKGGAPSWAQAKTYMQSMDFLKTLINYPKEKLNDKMVNGVLAIRQKMKEKMKGEDLTPEKVEESSKPAAELFRWVLAIVNYHSIAKKVEPKKQLVIRLEKNLRDSERELEQIKADVQMLMEMQRSLAEKLDRGQQEARKLQEQTALMHKRLDAANRLIGGLGSERKRWTSDSESLKVRRLQLVGDCLIGAAFLSYLGAFTFDFRKFILQEEWQKEVQGKGIPMSPDFKVETLLTDEVEIAKWNSDGLPSDELSVQNGILTTQSSRFALCIDPQMQAVAWIKKMNQSNSRFEVASFSDSDFLKRLEFCISYGNPFLFENMDESIDPIIDPVLEKNFTIEAGRKFIKLGDKSVEWDDNFRLFMCTKLGNPNYPPEVYGKTMVINYGVTQQGLQAQLLNIVVAMERSDLEKQREELIQTMSENKATLKTLEETLIRELALATGNILDNDDLISTLEKTKESAADIAQKLAVATATSKDIEVARLEYMSVAKRGAILFFVMDSLSAIDNMYEYSLMAFNNDVFRVSLEKSEPHFDIENRLNNIIDYLTLAVYRYVCMGIFEKHKLMLSFQMTVKILEGEGKMNLKALDFFLKGNIMLGKSSTEKFFPWMPEQGFQDLLRLPTVDPAFSAILEDVQKNGAEWQTWFDLERPEASPIPGGYSEMLTPFQKMLLLRCFRVDRVYLAVSQFIAQCPEMGEKYCSPPILKYVDVYKQSTQYSPIVCIISPGANPADEIQKLADKMDLGSGKMRSVSLGQGQGEEAMRLTETGQLRGQWVLLQNCHLLIDWMKELEKMLMKRDSKPHQDFRLWLTTEPTQAFPLGILQSSLKVVNEPPNGLRMNMKNTWSKVTEEILEACPHYAFRPLVFVLAFFHAVVQERRKYGTIGWNVVYDYNETDFVASRELTDTYLTKAFNNDGPIPWASLRYLVGEVMYGGRVTDSMDRRVVVTYLEEYMGDFLFDTFQKFHFYINGEVDYKLPDGEKGVVIHRDVYAQQIENMPMENSPEVFGLHPNAEIGYLTNSTKMLWVDLLELQPRTGGGTEAGGETRETVLERIVDDLTGQIPSPFDRKQIFKAEKAKNATGYLQPTQVVLLQELERWNNLVEQMLVTLKDLKRALAGIIGMSASLDDLATSLYNGQLPAAWRKLAPATRKLLGSWLGHFHRRHAQYRHWVEKEEPLCIWLSGLMIPESYLTALVQTTCRKYKWPLDKSSLFTCVTEIRTAADVTTRPEDGCYIQGLYLEGAQWSLEKRQLVNQDPKVLIYELPVVQAIPMETARIKLQNTLKTPVYVTQGRRNAAGVGLVFDADLATERHPSHWILEGVAMTLNTDD